MNKIPNRRSTRFFSNELTADTILLETKKLCSQYQINPDNIQSRIDEIQTAVGKQMILSLQASVASKKYAVKTVRFPADWWQGLKERFAPRWMLKRFPVTWSEITMEASAYYPEIAIPNHAAFVEVIMNSRIENAYYE